MDVPPPRSDLIIDIPLGGIGWLMGRSFYLIVGLIILAGCLYTLYRIEDVQKASDLKCAAFIKAYCPDQKELNDFQYISIAVNETKNRRGLNAISDFNNNTDRPG